MSAIAGAVIGGFKGNKYTTKDAIATGNKARAMKDLINKAAQIVYPLEEKYIANIKKINPAENIVSSSETFKSSKEGREMEKRRIANEQGLIAGLKYDWTSLSKTKKILYIIGFILFMLALLTQE
jgi:hypothetical protein